MHFSPDWCTKALQPPPLHVKTHDEAQKNLVFFLLDREAETEA